MRSLWLLAAAALPQSNGFSSAGVCASRRTLAPLVAATQARKRCSVTVRMVRGDEDWGPGSEFPVDRPSTSAADDYMAGLRRQNEAASAGPVDPSERERALQAALERQQRLLRDSGAADIHRQVPEEGAASGGSLFADLLRRAKGGPAPPPPPPAASRAPQQQQQPLQKPLQQPFQQPFQQPLQGSSPGFDPYASAAPAAPEPNEPLDEYDAMGLAMQQRRSEALSLENDPLSARLPEPPKVERPDDNGGGTRFRQLMEQARQQRPSAGERAATAAARAAAPPPQRMSQEEKDRIYQETVARQMQYLAKQQLPEGATGIDPNLEELDDSEIARRRMIARMQMEARGSGYVPSSSAAEDYINALKKDTVTRREAEQARWAAGDLNPYGQARSSGNSAAEMYMEGLKSNSKQRKDEWYATMSNSAQRNAAQTARNPSPSPSGGANFNPPDPNAPAGVATEADKYMMQLKGIAAEVRKNPYLEQQQQSGASQQQQWQKVAQQQQAKQQQPPPPPPPQAPAAASFSATAAAAAAAPELSYAEQLRRAKAAKGGQVAGMAAAPPPQQLSPPPPQQVSASALQPPPVQRQVTPSSADTTKTRELLGQTASPDNTQKLQQQPQMTYAEQLAESRAKKAAESSQVGGKPEATKAQAVGMPVSSPPPQPQQQRQRAMPAEQPSAPEMPDFGDGNVESKVATLLNLLADWHRGGLQGAQVQALRLSLTEVRDALSAETYPNGAPPTPAAAAPPAKTPPLPASATTTAAKLPEQPSAERSWDASRGPSAVLSSAKPAEVPVGGGRVSGVPGVSVLPPKGAANSNQDVLRRCNALLMAHLQGSLGLKELSALRSAMVAALSVIDAEISEFTEPSGSVGAASPTQIMGWPSAAAVPSSAGSISAQVAIGEAAIESKRPVELQREPPRAVGGVQSLGSLINDMGLGKGSSSGGSSGAELNAVKKPMNAPGQAAVSGLPAAGAIGGEEVLSPFSDGGPRHAEFKAVTQKALGYLVKHRGGAGFGRGRLRGREAAEMADALQALQDLLAAEVAEL